VPRGRRDGLIPGQSRSSPKAWAGDRENLKVGSQRSRGRKDGCAEPFACKLHQGAELPRFRRDLGDEASVATGVLEHRAQAAAADERDNRVLAQLGERDALAAAERIVAADGEDKGLGGNHARTDPGRQRLGAYTDDRGVEVAVANGLEERLVVFLRERDLNRGMLTMEVAERFREAVVDWPGDPDPQPSVELAAQRSDRFATALGCGDRRPRVRQELLTGGCEGYRAAIATKERLPELALQATDLCADRRLGNQEAGRRARELPLLSNGHEVGKLPQVHNKIF
jgi:hypothetical protein